MQDWEALLGLCRVWVVLNLLTYCEAKNLASQFFAMETGAAAVWKRAMGAGDDRLALQAITGR